jgi:hypothetical protein
MKVNGGYPLGCGWNEEAILTSPFLETPKQKRRFQFVENMIVLGCKSEHRYVGGVRSITVKSHTPVMVPHPSLLRTLCQVKVRPQTKS